jgi:hypothetical protein
VRFPGDVLAGDLLGMFLDGAFKHFAVFMRSDVYEHDPSPGRRGVVVWRWRTVVRTMGSYRLVAAVSLPFAVLHLNLYDFPFGVSVLQDQVLAPWLWS